MRGWEVLWKEKTRAVGGKVNAFLTRCLLRWSQPSYQKAILATLTEKKWLVGIC